MPSTADISIHPLLMLQQTIGNREVQRRMRATLRANGVVTGAPAIQRQILTEREIAAQNLGALWRRLIGG